MWRDVFVEKTVCQLERVRRSKNSTTMSAIAVAFLALRHDYRRRPVRHDGLFGSAVQQDNTDRSEKGASSDQGGVRGNRADGSDGRRMDAGGLSLRPGSSGGKSAEHAQSTARGRENGPVTDHEWPDGLREASHGPLSKPRGKRT